MIYKYSAKKGAKDTVEGTIEAHTEDEAIEKLSQLGYLPISLTESNAATTAGSTRSIPASKRRGKVKSRQITLFSRQLASLLRSQVPILRALNIIKEQIDNPYFQHVINDIHDQIKEGSAFSTVLAQYPKIFSNLYIAMVRAGEDAGKLPEALVRVAEHRMKQEAILVRIRTALAYPSLMAVVGLGTIIFMFVFVMPRLMNIFNTMGQALPLPTQVLVSISQALRQWWQWILLVVAIFIFMLRYQMKTRTGRISWGILKLHLPILGNLMLKAELSRFCRSMELLINNGVPILKAVNIAVPVLENEIIKKQLNKCYKDLEQGGSFGKSLGNLKTFPSFMSNLIIVGEESGRLDEALAEIASSYEQDTDEAIKVMSSLLEPLMILGMGLVVGFIVIAMLLPIFEINVMAG